MFVLTGAFIGEAAPYISIRPRHINGPNFALLQLGNGLDMEIEAVNKKQWKFVNV